MRFKIRVEFEQLPVDIDIDDDNNEERTSLEVLFSGLTVPSVRFFFLIDDGCLWRRKFWVSD